ncbi:MAG TPA: hypothetical protein VIG25_01585 [Pyrinomonadaceae bacterium]|jgi:hypothetical protein
MKTFLISLFLFLSAGVAQAQYCNPAVVHYIVRDEKGTVLSKAELEKISGELPKQIGDADVSVDEVVFAADKKTFYWPESDESEKGTKVPVLVFANAGTCTLHLTEVPLKYHGRSMKLIFNIDIARNQDDRRPVVDSLKFQNGTFKLDLTKWTHARDKLIPATHWRFVKR